MSCGEGHELLGPFPETTTSGKLKRSGMELLGTLFRGLVIGFSIAAPVGPVGVRKPLVRYGAYPLTSL